VLVLRRLACHPTGRAAVFTLAVFGAACVLAPVLAPAGPEAGSLSETLRRPDARHWLGTDELGRDVLARLLWGGRVSLSIALLVTVAAPVVGTAYGLMAAAAPSALGELQMRLVDGLLAVPRLPLYLVLLTLVGPGYWSVVSIMAAFEWPFFARLAYLAALGALREPFVEAAKAQGASDLRIVGAHVWPSVAGTLLVAAAVGVRGRVVAETSLSYLGFGIVPPTPSWGNMLAAAQSRIWDAPLIAVYPGVAILIVSVAATLLGDALRDALDPTARRGRAARSREDDDAHRTDRLAA
jgi:ABC-type dipeptide/oligopeptide/nickel transport system permease subunit